MAPRVGATLPDLSLPGLDGAPRALAEIGSRGPALLAIGHSDCRTSRETLPYLDRIHRRRRADAQVVVVLQDDAATARRLVEDLGLDLPILLESDPYPLARALDLVTVPSLLEIAGVEGIARISEGFVRDDLEALAARLGAAPLFTPGDESPAWRPG